MPGMSSREKLKKGRPLTGFSNTLPVVGITASVASVAAAGGPIAGFTATAVDAEQGDISSTLVWTVGVVQVGVGSPASLDFVGVTPGVGLTLTATATDSFAADGVDTVLITVT